MKIKQLLAYACALLLLTLCGCGGEDSTDVNPQPDTTVYRNVKVLELSGSATLTRDAKQQLIYKSMIINGGDNIVTAKSSTVDLLLDSDKYARIYESSDVTFKLEGSPSKGAIRIYLNKGGINSKIENKLSAGDAYEVHTPDAVMAVRGTEFEVKTETLEGVRQTTVTTSSGSVEITLPDGQSKHNEAGETTVVESKPDADGNMGKPEFKNDTSGNTSSDNTTSSNTSSENNSSEGGSSNSTTSETIKICPKCEVKVENVNAHLLNCGDKHYSCDTLDHSKCKDCGKLMCDISVHTAYECSKHYPCSVGTYDGHEAMDCGHYMCELNDSSPTTVHEKCIICSTYACKTDKEHMWADCGCVVCDESALGAEHVGCEYCGMCKSDGKTHGMCQYCYGCISDGRNHSDYMCNTSSQ